MRIEQQIRQAEESLKALHYERDMQAKTPTREMGAEIGSCNQVADWRWTPEGIRDIVAYHQPSPDGIQRITAIRTATEMFLRAIVENCPDSADRSAAIRHAREAMMTANASIVLNGRV